ncbi:MAG TPA: J domain-containing protein [Vicinamibacterales bacterium]|jgi:molecular chaperone DnaJ
MDLYALLGLAPGATSADIKRAHRRLARRYHPDINPGDQAAELLYRRILEAYETLVDPERRRHYDAGAPKVDAATSPLEFSGFDFSAAAYGAQAATFSELFADVLHPLAPGEGRPENGADLHATLVLAFEESMHGGERQVVVTRQDVCRACRGGGVIRTPEGRCAPCHGTGHVRWARGHMVFTKACAACHGSGQQRTLRCAACIGSGRQVRTEAVPVAVPPGIVEGARLRVPEMGHAGRQGGRNGDLYVSIQVQPHPVFRRQGDDLCMTLPIGVHEAVLGARVEVPSLEGPVRLRVPPGTQAGQRFRLRERGVPVPSGRGDIIVEIRIVLPAIVDERGKELMREFGKLYGQ